MSKDIMDYRPVRVFVKGWVFFLLSLLLFGPVYVIQARRAAAPFRREFTGMKESEVVALLGEATSYDGQEGTRSARPAEYFLKWSNRYGSRLVLKFKGGVVIDRLSNSR